MAYTPFQEVSQVRAWISIQLDSPVKPLSRTTDGARCGGMPSSRLNPIRRFSKTTSPGSTLNAL